MPVTSREIGSSPVAGAARGDEQFADPERIAAGAARRGSRLSPGSVGGSPCPAGRRGTTRRGRRRIASRIASRPISIRKPISSRRVSVTSASTRRAGDDQRRVDDRSFVDLARRTLDRTPRDDRRLRRPRRRRSCAATDGSRSAPTRAPSRSNVSRSNACSDEVRAPGVDLRLEVRHAPFAAGRSTRASRDAVDRRSRRSSRVSRCHAVRVGRNPAATAPTVHPRLADADRRRA